MDPASIGRFQKPRHIAAEAVFRHVTNHDDWFGRLRAKPETSQIGAKIRTGSFLPIAHQTAQGGAGEVICTGPLPRPSGTDGIHGPTQRSGTQHIFDFLTVQEGHGGVVQTQIHPFSGVRLEQLLLVGRKRSGADGSHNVGGVLRDAGFGKPWSQRGRRGELAIHTEQPAQHAMKRFGSAILARELGHRGPPTRVWVQIQVLLCRPFVAVFAEQEEFDLDRNVISPLKDGFQLTVHPFAVGTLGVGEHHQANGSVFRSKTPTSLQRRGSNQRAGSCRVGPVWRSCVRFRSNFKFGRWDHIFHRG